MTINTQNKIRNLVNSVYNPRNLEADLKRLKSRVEVLERELAKSNADTVLILVQDLSAMKKDIGQIKATLKSNKKFAELL